ncbi:DDB1- and CUL4-associated factor 6 [Mortierella sp. 14UC]|nr:DDB1- and CUL4-associated factor 6 [Mortierella sp. 14UC]
MESSSEAANNKRHNRTTSTTSSHCFLKGLSSLQTVPGSRQASIKNHILASESFIKRLEQHTVLKGHRGCVNTIAWDSTGEFLVSGSDDRRLNIYRPLDAQPLIHSIPSGHTQNIFSAKFLTGSSAQTIVSCSADGITRLTSVPRFVATSGVGDWSPSPGFNCHTSMTYEVMADLVDGHIFYDCADDGRFNRYDTRIRTICDCDEDDTCERHTFININSYSHPTSLRGMSMEDRLFHTFRRRRSELGISAIAQQPGNPVYFAAACSDDTVRIYDSRKVDPSDHRGAQVYSFSAYIPTGYVIGPDGNLVRGSNSDRGSLDTRITSLKYDSCRTGQLLVSYSRGNCFLIDPTRLETKSDEEARLQASDRHQSTSQSRESPGCKRRRSTSAEPAEKSRLSESSSSAKAEAETTTGAETKAGVDTKTGAKAKAKSGKAAESSDDDNGPDPSAQHSQADKHKRSLRLSSAKSEKGKGRVESDQEQGIGVEREGSANPGAESSVMDVEGKNKGKEKDDVDKTNDHDDNIEDDDGEYEDEEDEEMSFEDTDDEEEEHFRSTRPEFLQEQLADDSAYWRQRTYSTAKTDLAQTYWGHANVKTMIKEANFYGPNSEFVMSGSDDGRIFVWNKKTGRLVNVVRGDKRVVNCLQPHPHSKFLLAASGIDNTIKIIMPTAEERVDMSKVQGIKKRVVVPYEVKPDSLVEDGWPKGLPEDELDPEHAYERMVHVSSSDQSDDSDIHFGSTDDDDDDDDEDAEDLLDHFPPHMILQILRQFTQQSRQQTHDSDDPEEDDDDEQDDE